MKTPAPGGAARAENLMVFRCGGARFAVEASRVQSVAGVGWVPPGVADSSRVVELSALLDLPGGKGTRTLLVATTSGPCGFVVESISRGGLAPHDVQPPPPALLQWMRPAVISGFALYRDSVVAVLDLERLAELVERQQREADTQRGPGR